MMVAKHCIGWPNEWKKGSYSALCTIYRQLKVFSFKWLYPVSPTAIKALSGLSDSISLLTLNHSSEPNFTFWSLVYPLILQSVNLLCFLSMANIFLVSPFATWSGSCYFSPFTLETHDLNLIFLRSRAPSVHNLTFLCCNCLTSNFCHFLVGNTWEMLHKA